MKVSAKTGSRLEHGGEFTRASLGWMRLTSVALILALTTGVAVGASLHPSENNCNMPMDMPGCEHTLPTPPDVASMRLCCLLDCQQPGSTGSVSAQVPSLNLVPVLKISPRPTFILAKPLPQPKWQQGSSFKPPDTYLKNLALLI
jgi:hypothetical protein